MATAYKRNLGKKRKPEEGGVFRILVGEHLGQGPEGCECDSCYGGDPKNHRYVSYETYVSSRRHETRKIVQELQRAGFKLSDAEERAEQEVGVILPFEEYDGDIIETEVDLVARFNRQNSFKFERVREEPVYVRKAVPAPAPPTPTPTSTKSSGK